MSNKFSGAAAVLADVAAGERPIPLNQLRHHPRIADRGRRPHISVFYRWITRGLRGHRLEAARCGGSICTTESALNRFYARLSATDESAVPRAGQRRALATVEHQLEKEGL